MIDNKLRHLKDEILKPIAEKVGNRVSPMTITLLGGCAGVLAAFMAWQQLYVVGLLLWWCNRFLDGMDGAVARRWGKQSDFGGYVDMVVDFFIYTIVPFGLVMGQFSTETLLALAFLLGAFYINAGAFLYLSAILERKNQGAKQGGELTTITMPVGIVEGAESAVFYSLFFLLPNHLTLLFLVFGTLTLATVLKHLVWASRKLS